MHRHGELLPLRRCPSKVGTSNLGSLTPLESGVEEGVEEGVTKFLDLE